jgi:Cu/Ag efflux protein CusF
MRKSEALLSVCLLLIFAVAGLSLQNPPAPAAQQPPAQAAEKSYSGTLSKVDLTAKEVTVKGSDNKEMVFTYSDRTQISGVDNGPQGLSGKTGASLKITYQEGRGSNMATKIEIAAQK